MERTRFFRLVSSCYRYGRGGGSRRSPDRGLPLPGPSDMASNMRRIAILVMTLALSAACGKKQEEQPPTNKDDAPANKDDAKADKGSDEPATDVPRYQVRGRFMGAEGKTIKLHHEAIPDFRSRNGEKVGMMAMQMRFRVGDDLAINTLADNDVIEFEFVVEWGEKPPIKVVKISKLPADTELNL